MTKTREEIEEIILPIIQQEILSTHTEASDAASAVTSALIAAGVIPLADTVKISTQENAPHNFQPV